MAPRSRQAIKRARDGAGSANRNHHKECHHIAQGVIGLDREQLSADHSAKGGETDSQRKTCCVDDLGADAERRRHRRIIHRSAQFDTKGGAFDQIPKPESDGDTAEDGEELVRSDRTETEVDRPLQIRGEGDSLQRWPENIIGDAYNAEGDADRHQDLRQLRRTINAPVEEPFERDGNDDGSGDSQDHRQTIGKAEIPRRIGRDVAADHGKGAVGKVNHPHQPHRHREADGNDEQDHPIGKRIDANAEEGLHQIILLETIGTASRSRYFAAARPGSGCFSNVLISLL